MSNKNVSEKYGVPNKTVSKNKEKILSDLESQVQSVNKINAYWWI